MTRLLRLLILGTLVLVPMLATVGMAAAGAAFVEVSGTETLHHVVDPGTTTYPDGNMLVRGLQLRFVDDFDDPRLDGPNTVTINANFRPSPSGGWEGPVWGTFHLVNAGGCWHGTWTGYSIDGNETIRVQGEGGQGYTGLLVQLDGAGGAFSGRIIETER